MPPRRILVVDDEEDAATTLVELLTLQGHQVRVVGDGPSALDAAREDPPEVVLLDLGLPGMDGYEVATHLREAHGVAIRIFAMTGYRKDPERLREAGFDDHMLKPLDMERLTELLRATGAPGGAGSRRPLRP